MPGQMITDYGYAPDHEIRCPWCHGQMRCLDEGLGCGKCKIVLTNEVQRKVSRVRDAMRVNERVKAARDLIGVIMHQETKDDDKE